ncbi:MAG: hypothetical protein Q4P05_00985 [Actinomycetaceae bacterium]|nr:hypothetical protein [Actinomycetaceae bacterium]
MALNAFFIVGTTLAILALAVGVLFALMVSRRSVSDWQNHLTAATRQWKERGNDDDLSDEDIHLKRASLVTVMQQEAREGSAYFTADELRALDHLRKKDDAAQ